MEKKLQTVVQLHINDPSYQQISDVLGLIVLIILVAMPRACPERKTLSVSFEMRIMLGHFS